MPTTLRSGTRKPLMCAFMTRCMAPTSMRRARQCSSSRFTVWHMQRLLTRNTTTALSDARHSTRATAGNDLASHELHGFEEMVALGAEGWRVVGQGGGGCRSWKGKWRHVALAWLARMRCGGRRRARRLLGASRGVE